MDNLADVAINLLGFAAVVIAILWNKASKGAINVAGDAVDRWRDCEDSISSLRQEIAILKTDQDNLGRAQDARDADIREMNDFAYLMLQWIRDSVLMFKENEIEPPPVPRDFLLFGENYKGRYKEN